MRRQIPEYYKNKDLGQALGMICGFVYIVFIILAWVVKLVVG
jgi:hypothetical protein